MKWLIDLLVALFGVFVNKTPAVAVQAKEAGKAEEADDQSQAALAAETKIAQAEGDAPHDQASVVDELQKGQF